MKDHQFTNPFIAPGEQDITVNVNFALLAAIARQEGVAASCMSQAEFLLQLGIELRSQKLNSQAAALHRLTSPAEMGTLFRVLCL